MRVIIIGGGGGAEFIMWVFSYTQENVLYPKLLFLTSIVTLVSRENGWS